MTQLQLDANANVLLTAKLIYGKFGKKDHWETIVSIADHLVERWSENDQGIWEEQIKKLIPALYRSINLCLTF